MGRADHIDASIFEGRTILVTGGTGYFGYAIVKRLLDPALKVRRLLVLSRDEQKHVALQRKHIDPRVESVVGDVRDERRMQDVMRGVDVVFHAAALKHVHVSEKHPYEAVLTNVVGARNVVRAAAAAGVERLVAVSTDKAVQPVNVMGMTKALQERVLSAAAGLGGLKVGTVRYGNVLGSTGSVVPYFKTLLESGARELPVTEPSMTRFMLTIDEGIDLVLVAASHVSTGEVLVLADLPAYTAGDLAEVMLEAYSGGEVRVTGIRPGEKIHEVLLSNEELRRARRLGPFFAVEPYRSEHDVFKHVEGQYDSEAARRMSKAEIREVLVREGYLG